ncbi:unnamed protein product [Effrenium voratum]|nr:unnamed protein product [Effrenium voratum]
MASDKILTIQEWPNYPMMSLISMHDFAMGMFTQKQVFNETPTYCSSRESKDEENTVANMADFVIAAIGTTSYKSDPDLKFNRYLLYHKEHPNKVEAYVEFWEEVDTGMPHKYFLPNMENSPRAYFTSFRNISQDEFDAVEARLSRLDCHGPQIYGLVTPIMDADDTTPAHENMSTLEFYRALNSICLNEACQVSFGDDDYWNVILSLDALFRNRTEDVESDAPDGANATRRLASSIGVCLTDCKSLLANGWSYQRSSSKDKDFFGIVKFAYDTGTWTKGSSNPPMAYSSFKGSAQAGFSYNVPPVYISVRAHGAAQGEVTVRGSDGKVFSRYSGSVTLSFEGGLNIIIGQVTLGISGTISFEQASNPTSTPAMDVAGTIRGGITIKVLGGFVTASASVGLQARFWNLGPTFEGNDANDDEFAVAGKVRFKATIFWFFKMSFSAKMDIVKRRKLWSQTDLMGGYDPASIGLNCVEISKHDRDCSGTVQFRKFCPMNEEYSYDDPVNMQNCPYHYNTYDKSKGSMIFRHTNAAFFKSGVLSRDDAPEDVTWLCSSTGKSRDWGFRRRDGRRRWAKFAMANRFVIFGDEKNLGMVAYNCQY